MKWLTLLITTALLSLATAQDKNPWLGKKIPAFQLADGTIYKDATITRIDPDAIVLTHAAGVRRVPMEELKADSQAALGYDSQKAAKARLEREVYLKNLAAKQRAEYQALQAAAASNAAAKADAAAAQYMTFKVFAVTETGALANTYEPGGRTGEIARALGGPAFIPSKTGNVDFHLNGIAHLKIAESDVLNGWFVPDGIYEFEDTFGAKRSVRAFRALKSPPAR